MAASAACCVGQSVCCAVNTIKCCCCSLPWSSAIESKIACVIMFLLIVILTWVLSNDGGEALLNKFGDHLLTADCDRMCWLNLAVYRTTFSLVIYHGFQCLFLCGVYSSSNPRAKLQNGFWGLKVLLWFAIFVAVFFIKPVFFLNYWIAALTGSCIFLLLQGFFLILFAFQLDNLLVTQFEQTENNTYNTIRIGTTVLMYLFYLISIILLYVYYTKDAGCGGNSAFITVHLLLVIIFTIVSVSEKVQDKIPESGIFQSGIIAGYTTYLLITAALGETDCNDFQSSGSDPLSVTLKIIGLAINFVSLSFAAFNLGLKGDVFQAESSESLSVEGNHSEYQSVENDNNEDEGDQPAVKGGDFQYSFFHFSFFLVAFYVSCVMTDWNRMYKNSHGDFEFEIALNNAWSKIIASWLVYLLYLWILLAPSIFPDREFSML